MSGFDHDRVMTILADALDLPVSRRMAFLDSTCAGDAALRREVDELLEGERPAAACFDIAAEQMARADPRRIDDYTVIETLGEGGMAIVYKAEQRHPVKRTVALKLIKLGMDTRQFVARFEAERQALALMDHPNVARVFDAGSTDTGRPYFVMEYVSGQPVLDYCDARGLPVRTRLDLFVAVCEAVEHAHRKGILHRDLKNSNVLVSEVDGKPLPKVIDFGVAKAMQQPLTDRTLQTEHGQLIGTPEYMSPEQAEHGALAVDTRSDVYSLGVLLYELIAGVQPIPSDVLRGAGYEQVRRVIRETEPPRPSTRLSTLDGTDACRIAQRRRTALPALIRDLRSELEWIPIKAMRKDREQRYRSASELADDVRNYLDGRPLIAGPESARYKVRKFLRRHKAGVAASAAIVILLIGGIIATSWQAIRATRAEKQAQADNLEANVQRKAALSASENVNEVNRFLADDLLGAAAPEVTRGRELTVRQAVDRAADAIPTRFKSRPLTEGAIREALSGTYGSLGDRDRALLHVEAARKIYLREFGPDHRFSISATVKVGRCLAQLNRHEEAESLLGESLERARRLLGPDDAVTLNAMSSLAMCLRMQERFGEAEPLLRTVLDTNRRLHGSDHESVAHSLNGLAVLLNTQRRAAEAEPLYREAIEIHRRINGEDHPAYLSAMANLARVLEEQKKLDEAESITRKVLSEERRVLKEDHPSTLLTMNNLAGLLAMRGELQECEALHREALERRTRMLGADDVDTLQSLNNLATALHMQKKYSEALPLFRQAMEKRSRILGPTHALTSNSISGLANAYEGLGRYADAAPLLAQLYEPDALGKLSPLDQVQVAARYGHALTMLERFAEAEPVLMDARERLRTMQQPRLGPVRMVFRSLVQVCQATNRAGEAEKWRSALEALETSTRPATSPP